MRIYSPDQIAQWPPDPKGHMIIIDGEKTSTSMYRCGDQFDNSLIELNSQSLQDGLQKIKKGAGELSYFVPAGSNANLIIWLNDIPAGGNSLNFYLDKINPTE